MNKLPTRVDAVVVGAGLAGLAAARQIKSHGRSVIVVEAQDGVGGRVRTDKVDGFLLDRGFQVLLTAYPELQTQIDMKALDLKMFSSGALVMREGRSSVVTDPFREPRRALATVFAPVGTLTDKLRIAVLRWRVMHRNAPKILKSEDVSTTQALRDLGFSETMIDRFFRPLFGGIQLDPDLRTSRRMFEIIFKSLSEGQSALPANGMSAIPEQMAKNLGTENIFLNTRATKIETGAVTTAGGRVETNAVIVATDQPSASELLRTNEIASRVVGCVYFSADTPPTQEKFVVLDGTGQGPVLNAAVLSNVAPSYAPPGKHLIVAALPGIITGDLEAMSRDQLRTWWGPQVDGWSHLKTYRITHAGPEQQPPFNPKQKVSLGNGLFVCGDHRDTGSIQGALYSGRRCGEAVLASLA
ncbi:MAG: NAD(P)/FAD-dependent oxidoreductase [Acidimicrobiaceae bacterium]